MFQIGDLVFYSGSGVCRIDSVTRREFGDEKKDYYLLIPVHSPESAVYLPVDNEKLLSRMRSPLSCDEVKGLIRSIPDRCPQWIADEGRRKTEFTRILREGNQSEILDLIRLIHQQQQKLRAAGRKLHQCDERAFREAQRVLCDEFSLALSIEPGEVEGYIGDMLHDMTA